MRLVDIEDVGVIQSINNLMENGATLEQALDAQPTAFDPNPAVIKDLVSGEWVDSEKVQRALGMSFKECFPLFEFSREAIWWSIAGETEEERAREGKKVTTKFRIKAGGGECGTK